MQGPVVTIAVLDNGSEALGWVVDVLARAGAAVVTTASNVDDLLALTSSARPEVVLIDTGGGDDLVPRLRSVAMPAEASPLSPRESEVLSLLASGTHVAAIARRFGISVHTVRGHVKKILSKLGAHSQLEAVAKANARGWIVRRD